MRILKENTVAIIIDLQVKLFPHMSEKDNLERHVGILVKGLKILNIPCIVTEQYTKGLGSTIPSVRSLLENDALVEKNSFSCCDSSGFMASLQKFNPTNIIIAGIEAHICVLQTVTDLCQGGFTPVVVTDCISSRKENDKHIAMERMKFEGAILSTSESVLFEMLRFSGTEQFKAISGLIK